MEHLPGHSQPLHNPPLLVPILYIYTKMNQMLLASPMGVQSFPGAGVGNPVGFWVPSNYHRLLNLSIQS